MSEEDREELMVLPTEGIYRVKYHQISLKALRNYRTRILNKARTLRAEIAGHQRDITNRRNELSQLEKDIEKVTGENWQRLLDAEIQRLKEIEERANQFLRTYIGEENYQKLQSQGHFTFKGHNSRTYRVFKSGRLEEAGDKYWYYCCTIKPNLPMPDVIAGTFTAIKNPSNLLTETRKHQTTEEVVP